MYDSRPNALLCLNIKYAKNRSVLNEGGGGREFEHNMHVLPCNRKRRAITIVELVFNGIMLRRRPEYWYATAGKRASLFSQFQGRGFYMRQLTTHLFHKVCYISFVAACRLLIS
jgi:hypothetical protein